MQRLVLENFRGVKRGEIELAPLTILLGPNNSAKSTILEALFLLPNPFRVVPYSNPQDRHVYSAIEVLNEIHSTLDSRGYAFLLHKYVADKGRIQSQDRGATSTLELVRTGPSMMLLTDHETREGFTLPDGRVVYRFGRVSTEGPSLTPADSTTIVAGESLLLAPRLIKMAFEYLRTNWASIINLGVTRKVAKEASPLSWEGYEDFTIEPYLGGTLAMYAYLEGGRRVRLGDIGEGLQSYIVSRLLYEVVKPKVLLWDDIEAHLNPRILHTVASWIGDILKEERQAVLSTHSLEAARTMAGLNEGSAKMYLTFLDGGVLKTKSLTLQDVQELSTAGVDVRVAEQLLL